MKLKLQFIMAAFVVLAVYFPVAHGQARLTFSGGNGTPLSVTLQSAVTYTADSNCVGRGNGPFFNFKGVGNPIPNETSVTGTITFTINNGTPQSVAGVGSNFSGGDTSTNDIYLYGANPKPGVPSGGTVVLNAGTITTIANIAAAPPANGNYITYLTNFDGVRCSNIVSGTTAASVSISGRVLTNGKRGLANASVYLTNQNGDVQVSRTNSFGYYHFESVPAGQTVIVTVISKRFQFAPQVLNLIEEVTLLNFIADS